jgi:hypothetical protein
MSLLNSSSSNQFAGYASDEGGREDDNSSQDGTSNDYSSRSNGQGRQVRRNGTQLSGNSSVRSSISTIGDLQADSDDDDNADAPEVVVDEAAADDIQLPAEDVSSFLIEKNLPESNEMKNVLSACKLQDGEAINWDPVNSMLLNFVYNRAGAHVSATVKRTSGKEYNNALATEATEIVRTYPLVKQIVDGFLVYVSELTGNALRGDSGDWPPGFIKMFEDQKKVVPTLTWKRDHGYKPPCAEPEGTIVFHHFGSCIHDVFTTTKGVITSCLNKKWKAAKDLKSGESVAGLHRAIRKFWWYCQAKKTAVKYAKDVERRRKTRVGEYRKANPGLADADIPGFLPLFTSDEIELVEKEKYDKTVATFKVDTCYPDEWLTWLFLSKPNFIGLGACDAFNSGHQISRLSGIPASIATPGASGLSSNNPGATTEQVHASKALRQRVHSIPRGSFGTPSASGGSTASDTPRVVEPREVRIIHVIQKPDGDESLANIDKMKRSLESTIQRKRSRGVDTTAEEDELDEIEAEERAELRKRMRQNNA